MRLELRQHLSNTGNIEYFVGNYGTGRDCLVPSLYPALGVATNRDVAGAPCGLPVPSVEQPIDCEGQRQLYGHFIVLITDLTTRPPRLSVNSRPHSNHLRIFAIGRTCRSNTDTRTPMVCTPVVTDAAIR